MCFYSSQDIPSQHTFTFFFFMFCEPSCTTDILKPKDKYFHSSSRHTFKNRSHIPDSIIETLKLDSFVRRYILYSEITVSYCRFFSDSFTNLFHLISA